MTTTWREKLDEARREAGDTSPVWAYAPDEASFDVEFERSYEEADGHVVLAWTAERVYFPDELEGELRMHWAPRNPPSQSTDLPPTP